MKQQVIIEFKGEYSWLSNFWLCPISYEGMVYPSVENAFQAAKSKDFVHRHICSQLPPKAAKQRGRSIELISGWAENRVEIMHELLTLKFRANKSAPLSIKLVATHPLYLIEGNIWHDNFWGRCLCSKCQGADGKNTLGQLLMVRRAELLRGWSKSCHS